MIERIRWIRYHDVVGGERATLHHVVKVLVRVVRLRQECAYDVRVGVRGRGREAGVGARIGVGVVA